MAELDHDTRYRQRMHLPSRRAFVLCGAWLCCGLNAIAQSAAPAGQAELEIAIADYESGRLDAARAAFEALAARRVPAAEYNLGVMHLRGEVVMPDRRLARQLLQRAAKSGFVTAQFALGQAFENGEFGARDLNAAMGWYEVAATSGSVEAQVAIGTGYYLGRGRKKDYAQAAHWYREAAKGGDVGAMYLLASMYEGGDGVARDLRLARYWYDAAARAGDDAAPGKVMEIDAKLAVLPGAPTARP